MLKCHYPKHYFCGLCSPIWRGTLLLLHVSLRAHDHWNLESFLVGKGLDHPTSHTASKRSEYMKNLRGILHGNNYGWCNGSMVCRFCMKPTSKKWFNTKPGDLESSEFHQLFIWSITYCVECSSPIIGTSQCNIIHSIVGCVCLRLYNCSKACEYTKFNFKFSWYVGIMLFAWVQGCHISIVTTLRVSHWVP